MDATGDLFVADEGNKRVVKLAPPMVAATPSPPSSSTATVVSGSLTGLSPGTTYYYRAVATSAGGTGVTGAGFFATAPALAIGGPAVTYNTGGPAIAVAPAAKLTTGDASLADAVLDFVNTKGGQSDRLSIRASGSLAISGTTLSFSGTQIGTFSGGASTTPLVFTFNSKATQAAILAVVHNVTFHNAVLNPGSLTNRNVTIQLNDGAGNHGAAVTQTLKFATPPVLAINGPAVTYNTGGPAIAVAPAASLSSGDGDFAKALLTVVNTNGGQSDRLNIRVSGNVTVAGTSLSYSCTAIGTFTGGATTTPLVGTFNAKATQAAILAVVHNVTLRNIELNPGSLSNRNVTFQLTDGAGNHGAVVTQSVKFTTPPVLAIGGPAITYQPGGPAIAIAPAATLSAGDGKFAKASLSVIDTTFASYQSDRLSIRSSGSLVVNGTSLVDSNVTIGSFAGGNAGMLTISFNSSATEAAILAVIRNVTFSNINPTPTIANRSIKFQLTDGAGNLGAAVTQTVTFS